MGGIERVNSMPAEAKTAEMVPKENGEEREDRSGDLEKDTKQRKDAESDYEPARDSVSSQGEGQSIEDSKVKRSSRVPQKLAKQHNAGSTPRTSKSSTNDRKESKLQFKTFSNGQKKSQRPNKGTSVAKNIPEKKTEVTKFPDRPPSESSEGSDEKVIEEKTVEEVKEMDVLDEAHSADQSIATDDETVDTEENSLDGDKVVPYQKIEEMELRIEKLEQELREVAALEISLYSVVPEHGSSAHKVHTPARRLSRLYIHACKHWTQDKRATVARNTVSGLVLIAKSCGNDVPRLTFWLSNTVVLREIISRAFGVSSQSSLVTRVAESNGFAKKADNKSPSLKWGSSSPVGKQAKKVGLMQFADDWQETSTFTAALEKIESWIFSRIVESVWWQTLTPHMQPPVNDLNPTKTVGRLLGPALGDQDQGSFSIDLWKSAFQDAFTRLCPVRAGGHECGCLPVLARMVMEQCVSRLDVAMFNAILRESASEIPTDPVSDPIVDHKVLPIPAGDLSFGSGAQLKNSVGNWSRWLTDNFGMDDADASLKDGQNQVDDNDDDRGGDDAVSKTFYLLNSLSDLLMLPKDMLLNKSIRKEVCPSIGVPLITRILCNFTPDEFCPDPVPGIILEELYAESLQERRSLEKDLVCSIPCTAAPIVYRPPSPADVAEKVADAGGKPELTRNASAIQRKGYTSDDDLDDLDSPLTSIIDKNMVSLAAANGVRKEGTKKNARYELLREVWSV
ncbi:hypothetical protein Taro_038622 [Colocasia esculenta]|uniref:LSG n=1 Tax=Colocasia esculenta TaxID=4460 RepID=A0A843WGD5_COLES|nr:hypothetical protein [Colocasia esculenta]